MSGVGGAGTSPSRLLRWGERARIPSFLQALQEGRLGTVQEWASLGLLFLTLAVATWSIERAGWIRPQPSLLSVLAVSVVAGLLVLKSRLSTRLMVLAMLALGAAATVWQSVGLVQSSGSEWTLISWWRYLTGLQPNEGTLFFALFLILATWLIGFISTWMVLRRRNAWWGAGLGAVAILSNLSNLPRDEYYFLPVYAVVALLLVAQVHLVSQGAWPRRSGTIVSRRGIAYVVVLLVAVSTLAVGAAWVVPEPGIEDVRLISVSGTSSPGQWFNIFAEVRSKWSLIDSRQQETLKFSDPLSTSNRVQFTVTAERPAYWRVRRYDVYHPWGWTSSEVVDREPDDLALAGGAEGRDGERFPYVVENRLRTNVLLTVGEFVSADISVRLQTPAPDDPEADAPGAALADPEADDVIAVVTPRMMGPYQRYEAVGLIPAFTPEGLRAAGEEYPEEIKERYLQLPASLPVSVRLLARDLTRDAETAYDKTLAVLDHVLRLTYNVDAEVPPEGADAVAHFLFQSQEGVCTEFASAAAVLLRAAGVPARMNTGYLEGEFDEASGTYAISIKDYHARMEVYFPGYGWIEFPATPVGASYEALATSGITVPDDLILDPALMPGSEIFGPDLEFPGGAPAGATSLPGPDLSVYLAIIGIPVAIILAIRLAIALVLQRLKRASTATEVYARMGQLASLARLGPIVGETPLEYCLRLTRVFPEQTRSIDNIAESYTRTRYSQERDLDRMQQSRLQKSWVDVCPQLLRRALRFWDRPE